MRWIVLLAALAQIVLAWLPSGIGIGENVGARSTPVTTAATPAVWAFAIWGLIYAWCLVFAVWQALPAQRRQGLLVEARGPAAVLFTANAAWSLYVQLAAIDWISVAIILVGLSAGLAAMVRLKRFSGAGRAGWLAKAPLSLTAGWVSVAAFANIAAVLSRTGLDPIGIGVDGVAALLVLSAGLIAAWVSWMARANLAYPAAALWGLVAVAVANLAPNGAQAVVIAVGIGAIAVVGAVVMARIAARERPSRA